MDLLLIRRYLVSLFCLSSLIICATDATLSKKDKKGKKKKEQPQKVIIKFCVANTFYNIQPRKLSTPFLFSVIHWLSTPFMFSVIHWLYPLHLYSV